MPAQKRLRYLVGEILKQNLMLSLLLKTFIENEYGDINLHEI